jgi:hypothetical protein
MTPIFFAGAVLLSPLGVAQANSPAESVVPAVAPATSQAVKGDAAESNPARRLRESLRQTGHDGEAAAKPYRLSAEERQRLRDLIRHQSVVVQQGK